MKKNKVCLIKTGDVFYIPSEDDYGVVVFVKDYFKWYYKLKSRPKKEIRSMFFLNDIRWVTGTMHEKQKDRYKKLNMILAGAVNEK